MAFSVDSSLTHVPIDIDLIHEIYRSSGTVAVGITGGRPAQAFVCSSRHNGSCAVFVSFLDTVTRKIHVMAATERDVPGSGYDALLHEALALAADFGFSLEKVNLDFSPAIRQVIIRDIGVMHPPPGSRVRIARGQMRRSLDEQEETQAAPAPPAAAPAAPSPGSGDNSTETPRLREELSRLRQETFELSRKMQELTSTLDRTAGEKRDVEMEAAALRGALLDAGEAAARAESVFAEEKARLVRKIELLKKAAPAAEDVVPGEEVEALARLAEVARLTAQYRDEVDRLDAERRQAIEVAEILRADLAGVRARHEAALEAALGEVAEVARELALARDELAGKDRLEERAEAEYRQALAEKEDESCRLRDEMAAAEAEADRLREAIRQVKADARTSVVAFAVAAETFRRRATAAEGNLARLREEHGRFAEERPLLLAAARQAKRAQDEVQGLREELAQVRAPAVPAVAVEAGPQLQQSGDFLADALALLVADGEGFPPAHFGSADVAFVIDPDSHDVPYAAEEDIVAVYEAMNHVQAMPDGRRLGKCGAYIVIVQRKGIRHINNIWHLVEDGNWLIARPTHGETEASFESTLRDALFYFESVGFIMEPLDLGTKQKRARVLARLPLVRREAAVPPRLEDPVVNSVVTKWS